MNLQTNSTLQAVDSVKESAKSQCSKTAYKQKLKDGTIVSEKSTPH